MITYEEVRDIVKVLIDAKKEPSRKTVRSRLGNQGSYETIGKMIDRARAELGYVAPLSLVEEDDPPDDPPAAEYTPRTPDPAVIAQHLEDLRTKAAIIAAKGHLAGLCAALRCVEPALERIRPYLGAQYQAAVMAAGPAAALSMFRPEHQEPMDALTTACEPMLQAAEVMLSLLEKETTDGSRPAA